jgi:hypothetical protein
MRRGRSTLRPYPEGGEGIPFWVFFLGGGSSKLFHPWRLPQKDREDGDNNDGRIAGWGCSYPELVEAASANPNCPASSG